MAKNTVCNKCGKPFDRWDELEQFCIHQQCGYGTKYDGLEIELDLCCHCFEELVEECEISPIINRDYTH